MAARGEQLPSTPRRGLGLRSQETELLNGEGGVNGDLDPLHLDVNLYLLPDHVLLASLSLNSGKRPSGQRIP